MTAMRTSADLISLLENDERFRRDVAQWLLANQSVLAEWDAPASAIAPGSVADLFAKSERRQNEHEARLNEIQALTAHVVEMQRDMRERMDASEKRIDALEKRTEAFEKRTDVFADEMRAMNLRHDAFEKRMDEFSERMDAFSERMDAFSERMDAFAAEMLKINEAHKIVEDRVGALWGRDLERQLALQFRTIAIRAFGARGHRLVWSPLGGDLNPLVPELDAELERAIDDGVISMDQSDDLFLADLIAYAYVKADEKVWWFVGEASGAIGRDDVERARERADTLAKAKDGVKVQPFVYGYSVAHGVGAFADEKDVKVVFRRGSSSLAKSF